MGKNWAINIFEWRRIQKIFEEKNVEIPGDNFGDFQMLGAHFERTHFDATFIAEDFGK